MLKFWPRMVLRPKFGYNFDLSLSVITPRLPRHKKFGLSYDLVTLVLPSASTSKNFGLTWPLGQNVGLGLTSRPKF